MNLVPGRWRGGVWGRGLGRKGSCGPPQKSQSQLCPVTSLNGPAFSRALSSGSCLPRWTGVLQSAGKVNTDGGSCFCPEITYLHPAHSQLPSICEFHLPSRLPVILLALASAMAGAQHQHVKRANNRTIPPMTGPVVTSTKPP